MTEIVVKSQAELDAVFARDDLNYEDFEIVIKSPSGIWIELSDSHGLAVRASGSATVEAWGSANVEASGSATVEASGSATVRASGSATVEAWGSATVEAWGSATVRAWGSATVQAWGSATVRASGSATVQAWGSATVQAGKWVSVHLFSKKVTLSGGVLIDMTAINQQDSLTWCELNGVEIDTGGKAHLYKAVDSKLNAGHQYRKTQYLIGTDPECEVWRDDFYCGEGLHICPTAWTAKHHFQKATRFLEVTVPVADLRPIDETKAKARTVHVLREVDLNMKPVKP